MSKQITEAGWQLLRNISPSGVHHVFLLTQQRSNPPSPPPRRHHPPLHIRHRVLRHPLCRLHINTRNLKRLSSPTLQPATVTEQHYYSNRTNQSLWDLRLSPTPLPLLDRPRRRPLHLRRPHGQFLLLPTQHPPPNGQHLCFHCPRRQRRSILRLFFTSNGHIPLAHGHLITLLPPRRATRILLSRAGHKGRADADLRLPVLLARVCACAHRDDMLCVLDAGSCVDGECGTHGC